jgi:integrase/recombinase XerC
MTSNGEAVIDRHIDYMQVRGLSPLTIRARLSALRRLSEHLGAPILYASRDDLLTWLHRRVEGVSAGTRRNDISHLKAFYDWCVTERLLAHSPAERLPTPRAPHYLPRPMSEARFASALAAADPQTRAILALAGFVGLRACEIARLDWAEVDLDERVLRVACGKGGRARVVRISDPLAATLRALEWRTGPVIRSPRAPGYCSPNAITKRATRHLQEQGIPDRLHALRHRFATAALAGTGDLRAVSEAMGHASMNTTAIYARASASSVEAVVIAAAQIRDDAA